MNVTHVVESFPTVRIPSQSGGLAVEVSLITQLGHGAGNHVYASTAKRQTGHAAFIDELDEPSAKLAGTDFAKGDATALYSFVVGPRGHPFHRHAGHRIFTAVSGSGGAQLRFSTASDIQIDRDPRNFVRALRFVNIPPDCLFTVRFGGGTWHQFFPLQPGSRHPVLFALSCHTDELGGELAEPLRQKVLANEADIPALTEVLPEAVRLLLDEPIFNGGAIPVTTLALDAPAGTIKRALCDLARGIAGALRAPIGGFGRAGGYLSFGGDGRRVEPLATPPWDSLLRDQFAGQVVHHDDTFVLHAEAVSLRHVGASRLLAEVLEGFLRNRPAGVSNLMSLRNKLVQPLGLRTSPLGCPVSSLLSPCKDNLFAGRFPVLDKRISADDHAAQVVLGADDKHLRFRSCVGVRIIDEHRLEITLGTRVHCKNAFGRFYMAAIDLVHRRYVTPAMLRFAAEYALGQETPQSVIGRIRPADSMA
jgi:hypothetical protein